MQSFFCDAHYCDPCLCNYTELHRALASNLAMVQQRRARTDAAVAAHATAIARGVLASTRAQAEAAAAMQDASGGDDYDDDHHDDEGRAAASAAELAAAAADGNAQHGDDSDEAYDDAYSQDFNESSSRGAAALPPQPPRASPMAATEKLLTRLSAAEGALRRSLGNDSLRGSVDEWYHRRDDGVCASLNLSGAGSARGGDGNGDGRESAAASFLRSPNLSMIGYDRTPPLQSPSASIDASLPSPSPPPRSHSRVAHTPHLSGRLTPSAAATSTLAHSGGGVVLPSAAVASMLARSPLPLSSPSAASLGALYRASPTPASPFGFAARLVAPGQSPGV